MGADWRLSGVLSKVFQYDLTRPPKPVIVFLVGQQAHLSQVAVAASWRLFFVQCIPGLRQQFLFQFHLQEFK